MTNPAPPRPSIGRQFVLIFFGTAKRIIVTTLVVTGLLIWLVPPLNRWFVGQLLSMVSVVIAITVMLFIFSAVTGIKLRRKKGGSKSH